MANDSIQVCVYSVGGFAVHRITGDFEGKASAYFNADGIMMEAEFIRGNNSYPVKFAGPAWQDIYKKGKEAHAGHMANRKIDLRNSADALRESIKSTNNGYLFAPSGDEIEIAETFPDEFTVKRNIPGEFPNRIWNKG